MLALMRQPEYLSPHDFRTASFRIEGITFTGSNVMHGIGNLVRADDIVRIEKIEAGRHQFEFRFYTDKRVVQTVLNAGDTELLERAAGLSRAIAAHVLCLKESGISKVTDAVWMLRSVGKVGIPFNQVSDPVPDLPGLRKKLGESVRKLHEIPPESVFTPEILTESWGHRLQRVVNSAIHEVDRHPEHYEHSAQVVMMAKEFVDFHRPYFETLALHTIYGKLVPSGVLVDKSGSIVFSDMSHVIAADPMVDIERWMRVIDSSSQRNLSDFLSAYFERPKIRNDHDFDIEARVRFAGAAIYNLLPICVEKDGPTINGKVKYLMGRMSARKLWKPLPMTSEIRPVGTNGDTNLLVLDGKTELVADPDAVAAIRG